MLLPSLTMWHRAASAEETIGNGIDAGDLGGGGGSGGGGYGDSPLGQMFAEIGVEEPDEIGAPDTSSAVEPGPGPEGGDNNDGEKAPGAPGGEDATGDETQQVVITGSAPGSGTDSCGDDDLGTGDLPDLGSFNSAGDPIDVRLADKVHVQVDYLGKSAGALRLARVYHSNLTAFPAQVSIPMGMGWRNFYDRSIQIISATQVRLHRANGRTLDFNLSGSNWVSTMPGGTLTQVSGGWQYVNHRDVVELYGSTGKLQSLGRAGLLTALQYDTSGRLYRVVNPFNRALGLAYDTAGRLATITLPDNNTLAYSYDANNNLTSVRFADASVRQYKYENTTFKNALTGVVDESGRRRLTWGYDSAGRPNLGYYGNNFNRVSVVYGSGSATITDGFGTARTRTFGSAGGRAVLTSVQTAATADSPATSWSFGYDAAGNLSQLTSRTGEVRQFSHDGRARPLSTTRAVGTAVSISTQATWHPVFRKRTQLVARGITTNTTLDAAGRITAIAKVGTDGVSATMLTRSYNAAGLLQSQTDARGGTTTYTYDSAGNRTSVTNPQGQTTYFSGHTAHGQATLIQYANGLNVSRSYDVRGRLVSRTEAGATTSYSYDTAGRLLRATRPDGTWRQRAYDAAGYLSSITNHRNETIAIARDAAGNETSRTTYTAVGTVALAGSQQYNSHGRLARSTDSRGYSTQWTYAADGRPLGLSNPLGQTRSVALDALGRPVAYTQPNTTAMRNLGGPATVTASLAYHPTRATQQSATDTASVTTGYAPDRLNRQAAESGNDAGSTAWVHNNAGDTTSITSPNGVVTTVTRDSLGRVTSVTPAIAGTSGTSYGYVAGRKDNLLAYMTDPSGSTSWTYDSAGRLLSKSQNTGGITRGITLTRDSVGRVTRMVYPSGMALDYTYNGDLVTSIVAAGYPLMSNITYRPFSNVATGWTWGNGSTYSRSFDADGRITQVTLGDRTRSYAFDPVGRISGFTDSGSAGTQSSSFSYDEAGQLTAYSGPQGNYSYGYDTNGNRRSISANGSAGSYTFAAGTNRILTSPNGNFSYFAGGQPSSDGYYSFVYDGYNRLKQMTSADYRVVRSYNGQGQRVNSTVSQFTSPTALASPSIAAGQGKGAPVKAPNDGALAAKQLQAKGGVVNALPGGQWITVSARHFFHDDAGRLLGEYPAAGSTDPAQETVWFNGQPVGALINGVGYFVYADHLVTPRTLVRISDNVVAWQWHSEPFGNTYPTSSIGIAYNPRFPGQQFDADTGYHYNWMRDYYPANGRYLQADPIGLAGGLSRFGYVGGNPLSNSDLSGLLYVAVRVEFSDRFAVFHREDGPAFPMPTFVGFFTIQDAPCYFLCYFSDKKWNEGTENGKDMSSCQRKS